MKKTMRDKAKDTRKKLAAPPREGTVKKPPEKIAGDTIGLTGHGADSVLAHLREQERKRDRNTKT